MRTNVVLPVWVPLQNVGSAAALHVHCFATQIYGFIILEKTGSIYLHNFFFFFLFFVFCCWYFVFLAAIYLMCMCHTAPCISHCPFIYLYMLYAANCGFIMGNFNNMRVYCTCICDGMKQFSLFLSVWFVDMFVRAFLTTVSSLIM